MRIIHIIVGLNVGGAELMLKRLVNSHANQSEFEHSVISLTEIGEIGSELKSEGVKVTALGMASAFGVLRAFLAIRNELNISRPDIVQTWMYHADLLGGLAAYSVGIRHVIWGIRTTEIKAGGSSLTRLIRRMCGVLSRWIPMKIVCAANAAKEVHERVGYSPYKMLVIPNGFAIERLVATPEQINMLRKHAGITPAHRVIGSIGRFNPVKDQHNFVKAAGILTKQHSNLRFLMIGRGLDRYNTQLVKWIEETGQADKFVLFGERSDIPVCLAVMDVFCMHSRTEGFPNVLGEAMAMAKPCVATDVGDASLLVGNAGVLVPPGSPSALADGIEKLLSFSEVQLEEIGFSAQQKIYNNYTIDIARKRYESLYRELVDASE